VAAVSETMIDENSNQRLAPLLALAPLAFDLLGNLVGGNSMYSRSICM
jgi:hypothetical protein